MTTTMKGRDSHSLPSRGLLSDESGATMVMGIFMAMMVVGMIYYVWGIGGTIIHRERMQDAADASAFGASVFQARGMNIIAILNVLMAIFAVVGTACRLLQDFIEATAIADDLACLACLASVVCIPGAATFCEPAAIHDEQWASDGWLGQIADAADAIVRGIHGVQVVVRTGAQAAALEYSLREIPNLYRPTVTSGFFIPGNVGLRLPSIESEDDATNWACHHPLMYVRGPALALVLVAEFIFFEPVSVGFIAGDAWVLLNEFGPVNRRSEHYCNNGSLTFQRVPVDHWLGDGNFQNYGVVFGASPFRWVQNGVQIANWGRVGNSAPNVLGLDVGTVATLHGLSFADAEYYYEDTSQTTHQEWMWHTRWRARMRRFHAGSSVTGAIGSFIGQVENVIVH